MHRRWVQPALAAAVMAQPTPAGWMAEEIPFNAAQRTWERADIIVCGTPEIPYDPSTEIVIAAPPTLPGKVGRRFGEADIPVKI